MNGCLIHDWIEYFHSFWQREQSKVPVVLAQQERDRIYKIMDDEKALILDELGEAIAKMTTQSQGLIDESRGELNKSIDVLKTKCAEEIENDCALRVKELEAEKKQAKERNRERFWQFIVGALVALFSAGITNFLNKLVRCKVNS